MIIFYLVLFLDGTESIDGLPDDTNESVAIQRIKESMKEEVKKFEYDNHVPPAEYFWHVIGRES